MEEPNSIARELDTLFRTVRRDDGEEYSHRHVARFISDYLDCKMSDVYVGMLRKGTATDPRMSVILALARFFQVDPLYFLASARAAEATAGAAADGAPPPRRNAAPALLMRMNELGAEERNILAQTLELLERRRDH